MTKYNPIFLEDVDRESLPRLLGIRLVETDGEKPALEMDITDKVRNFGDSVHGGSIVTLADTAAGYGCFTNLPKGATGFTTLELKCNFIGIARTKKLRCTIDCRHRGKTTQVWDATVYDGDTDRVIAEFRCTQYILYPQPKQSKPEK